MNQPDLVAALLGAIARAKQRRLDNPPPPDLARVAIPDDHDHLGRCLADHTEPGVPCTDHPACWPDLCDEHADWEDA